MRRQAGREARQRALLAALEEMERWLVTGAPTLGRVAGPNSTKTCGRLTCVSYNFTCHAGKLGLLAAQQHLAWLSGCHRYFSVRDGPEVQTLVLACSSLLVLCSSGRQQFNSLSVSTTAKPSQDEGFVHRGGLAL